MGAVKTVLTVAVRVAAVIVGTTAWVAPTAVQAGGPSLAGANERVVAANRDSSPGRAGAARPGDPAFGLPPLPQPDRATDAQRELGRRLFFDRRLSSNGTMSCGMCHVPEEGFTSNASQLALGIEGRSLKRNAPTVVNVAWQSSLFHDGRRATLEAQAWDPLLHPLEMGNASVAQALGRIRRLDDYAARFARAFPGRGLDRATVGQALAAYQRSLVAADSAFDRWRWGRAEADVGPAQPVEADAERRAASVSMSTPAREGYALFTGKARCASCHLVGERDALLADGRFHVTGAGQRVHAAYDVPLAPGVATRIDAQVLAAFEFGVDDDLGRFDATQRPDERRAFKTPSLRNVTRTAPYMHDGSLPTLDAVIDFYDRGGGLVEGRSPLLAPLGLTGAEKAALVAFLQSLDSPHWDVLVRAARR
jgi:cytochrome c peroxidase